MGYPKAWREKVLLGAITRYSRILEAVRNGTMVKNRPGACSRKTRRHKKMLRPAIWFQTNPKKKKEKGAGMLQRERKDQGKQVM